MDWQVPGWTLVVEAVATFALGGGLVYFFVGRAVAGFRLQARDEKLTIEQQLTDLRGEKDELARLYAAAEPEVRIAGERAEELTELKDQVTTLRGRLQEQADESGKQKEELAKLREQYATAQEKAAWLEAAKKEMSTLFGDLSASALRKNNQDFGERTTDLLKPFRERLDELQKQIRELEEKRQTAYAELGKQLEHLESVNDILRSQTEQLRNALRGDTRQRAQWGEITLQRIVELAGMEQHVDYSVQESGQEGRPDLIVKLPGRGEIIVDAKAPMDAYLRSVEAETDNERLVAVKAHANAVRSHIRGLASKAYWQRTESAEFVVLFVPNDSVLHAALSADPALIEFALSNRVALAAPTSLFALLKAVAYGWQQHQTTENAQTIIKEVDELQKRMRVFLDHFDAVGKHLSRGVEAYNKTLSSYTSRLLPSVRRLETLRESSEQLPELDGISVVPQLSLSADGPPETGSSDSGL